MYSANNCKIASLLTQLTTNYMLEANYMLHWLEAAKNAKNNSKNITKLLSRIKSPTK